MIEALAILVIILVSGVVEISKRMREKSNKNKQFKPKTPPKSRRLAPTQGETQTRRREGTEDFPAGEEDTWSKMFKEMFDVEEPEVVIMDEPIRHEPPLTPKPFPPPPPVNPSPARRRKVMRPAEQTSSSRPVLRPEFVPSTPVLKKKKTTRTVQAARPVSPSPILMELLRNASHEPLKTAFVLHEILSRPRCLRPWRPGGWQNE